MPKFLVFVIESYFNNPTGTFYIDNIHLIDADDSLFDLDQHTDGEFLDLVSEKTFLYFLDWYDPNTGLFQDRSTFPDLMSTAATGFGLTALTIGESRGWISQTLAIEMVTRTLQTLCEGQAVTNTVTDTITGTNGYKGFFYHFLDNNGLRKTEIVTSTNTITGSELSPVDTAILIAGVLTAKEHFSNGDIDDLADELYGGVEWDWILDPGNNWFYLAWKPECGPDFETEDSGGGCFSNYYWNYYTDEVILINLLAIGSPTYPVSPEVFYAWTREWGTYRDHTLIKSWTGSFFTYVFAHLWVDFSILGTDNHPTPTLQVDWWDNSVKAAWANWEFVADHQDDTACDGDDDYTTYGESSWGLTAAEGPDGDYHAYGAPPAAITPTIHDGTVAPYGAGLATMFLPATSTLTLKHYFADTDLWRYRFGFGDAYNLDPPDCNGPWYNYATFGIDQGPMLIAIEDYRSGLVWDTMKRNDHIRRALQLIWLRVSISGPTTGTVNAAQTFTATVAPTLATTPITYVWQASGQSLVTHTRGLSDTASFIWTQPGTQVITVTVTNVVSTVVATHVITIYAPPTDVMIIGSTTGVIDSSYVFTATVSPATTTLPIDYVWQATDNSLEIHTDGGLSDTVVLDWDTRGMKAITVTATNIVSTVVATHAITIFTPPQAAFRASPISGFAPLTVVFTNTSTGDYIASLWDFGDEVTSTLESPTHTYTAVGVYTVTLMISGLGASDTEMKVEYIAVQEEYGIYLPLVAATTDDRAQAGSSATKPLRLGQRCALPTLPTALRRRRPTIEDPEHFQRSTTNTTSSGTYSGGSSIPGRP